MRNRHVRATSTSLGIILLTLLVLGVLPRHLAGSAALAATDAGESVGVASGIAPRATLPAGVVWQQEAEDGVIKAPMAVANDPSASGGQYVYCPTEWSDGTVTFTIDLAAPADYYLWVRAKGQSWQRNSFLISMDGGNPIHYEIPQFGGEWTWGWDMVRPVDDAPVVFSLGAGTHTLCFQVREANAWLDRLLLTNDPTYLPEGATTPQYVWRREAESGTLAGDMAVGLDTRASDCEYIYASPASPASLASYTFNVVVPGNYYLWVRAMGESYTNNSFFVRMDGGSDMHYEVPQFEGEWRWGWDAVHEMDEEVQPFALDTGSHTVYFRAREKNTRLDAVVITNDADYVPGEVKPCPITPTPTATIEPSATPTATIEPSATPTATPTVFVQPEGVLWLPIILF